jgi:hypothetical protein
MKKKPANKETSLVRSSAAEYLTFVAAQGEGGIEVVYADEDIWLTQKMMGILYEVETQTINYHLKKIFTDNELQEDSVIRKFRITAADGKTYDTQHYNLSATISVGYKVNSERAVQFRKWAGGIIKEYTVKGFAMDDERIKSGGTVLTKQYFEEQLQRSGKSASASGSSTRRSPISTPPPSTTTAPPPPPSASLPPCKTSSTGPSTAAPPLR